MSQMTEPPFSAPSTGWTEEMEAAARRPRPAAPARPRWRVALRVSVWGVAFTLILATVLTLLFIHRGDAEGSARIANSEVELLLERGETIDWRAPVMARHWWHYFRVTHGLLAATNRRLIYVGVPPEEILPREPEPQLLETSSFPYDRPIDVWGATPTRREAAGATGPRAVGGRVFLGTLYGIVIRSPGQMRTFGVASSERGRLDSVLTLMTRRQEAIRSADEDERQRALSAAFIERLPVYHEVESGEALELLARQYNVSVEQLQAWNNLETPRIRVGQNLLVKPRS